MTCSPDPIALLFRFELPFHAIRPLPQMISILIPRFTSPGRRIRRIKTSVHRKLKVLVLPPNRVPGQRSHRGGKHPQQRHSHNNVIFATTTGVGTAHWFAPSLPLSIWRQWRCDLLGNDVVTPSIPCVKSTGVLIDEKMPELFSPLL